ncbi:MULTISPECIES: hypothetical protein [Priestia]|nr:MULTISPECIES: hypothetical protein [Priestia]
MEWSVRHVTPRGTRGRDETPQRGGSDSSLRKASVRSGMERNEPVIIT